MTGMSAAEAMLQHGIPSTLYEKGDAVGGLAGSFEVNGAYLEKFYHHIFTTDRAMLKLVDELGVRDKLFFPRPTTSVSASRPSKNTAPTSWPSWTCTTWPI